MIKPFDGEPVQTYEVAYTLDEVLSLTFDRILPKKELIISSYDWNLDYTKEDVIDRVMSRVQPGSVIVMHILNDIHTPGVLSDVIESLQDEGYSFVLTSEWLE